MNDCISRLEAKKTMCALCDGGAKLVCGTLNDVCSTMRAFDAIPPARQVATCKECVHRGDMTDYISREAANIAIQKKMQEYINKSVHPLGFGKYKEDDIFTNAALGCRAALEELKSIPAADVREVKRGRWVREDGLFRCSICYELYLDKYGFHFCPNCGADMKGAEKP